MASKKRPPFRKALWISGTFALISLALFFYAYYNLQTFLRSAKPAVGKVSSFMQQRKVFKPIIKFKTETGELISFTAPIGSSDTSLVKTGSPIKLLYHPNVPTNAVIDDFWQIWQPNLMILLFGISPFLLVLLLKFILVPRNK